MPKTKDRNDVVNRLIAIGKAEEFEHMALLFSQSEQSDHPRIASTHQSWLEVIESLDTDELIAIIKSLTMGEREFKGWKAGSVSPVIRLFRKLCTQVPNEVDAIAEWVLSHTDNPYLPWGTMTTGAKTLAEFHAHESAEWSAHLASQAEHKRQEEARERNAQKGSHNLFVAINSNDEKGVEALINRGAYVKDLVVDGMTAMELAKAKGNQKIIETLRAAGAND